MPRVAVNCFIAETATLAGDVTLDAECSVWFSAVLRAEAAPITVGKGSNIQDNCSVHTDEGFPTILGEGVSVGHGAIIHGSRIGSNCLIGIGAVILNGSEIGSNCIIGAGSLVLQGTVIESNTLVLGSPAAAKRKVTDAEVLKIRENAKHYYEFRSEYLKRETVHRNEATH
ncbi:MAG: gamma carbonic anhydrase family protein [Nitrososphaerales archaeon]